jgi:hypothetical protein
MELVKKKKKKKWQYRCLVLFFFKFCIPFTCILPLLIVLHMHVLYTVILYAIFGVIKKKEAY